jgi:hypothetical protein
MGRYQVPVIDVMRVYVRRILGQVYN